MQEEAKQAGRNEGAEDVVGVEFGLV